MEKYFKYFSLKSRAEIESLLASESPQTAKRLLAEELTKRIHGEQEFQSVLAVSSLLFDPKADRSALLALDERTLETVAGEIPSPRVARAELDNGIGILDFLAEKTGITPSKNEAKNAIKNNAISVNKQKISALDHVVSAADLLHGRFLMVENGKKNKFLVEVG